MTFNPINYPEISPGAAYYPTLQGNLWSNYSRNPNAFKINKLVSIVPVTKQIGLYGVLDQGGESRIPLTSDGKLDLRASIWDSGAQTSINFAKKNSFQFYNAIRRFTRFAVDYLTDQQAAYPIVQDHANSAGSAQMLKRSMAVYSFAGNTANWVEVNGVSTNTDTAADVSGGQWDTGSSTNRYIQDGVGSIVRAIEKHTNAVANAEGLCAVMSPTMAVALAKTPEYVGYMQGSVYSLPYLQEAIKSGPLAETFANGWRYGLGSLYGTQLVCENAVVNTAKEGAADNFEYLLDVVMPNSILFTTRAGFIQSSLNTMSTLTLALHTDMSTIIESDVLNQVYNGVVFDVFDVVLRPSTGFLLTSVLDTFEP